MPGTKVWRNQQHRAVGVVAADAPVGCHGASDGAGAVESPTRTRPTRRSRHATSSVPSHAGHSQPAPPFCASSDRRTETLSRGRARRGDRSRSRSRRCRPARRASLPCTTGRSPTVARSVTWSPARTPRPERRHRHPRRPLQNRRSVRRASSTCAAVVRSEATTSNESASTRRRTPVLEPARNRSFEHHGQSAAGSKGGHWVGPEARQCADRRAGRQVDTDDRAVRIGRDEQRVGRRTEANGFDETVD